MKDIFTIMQFTMKDMIKRKSFIISTIIIVIFIIVGLNIPNIIKSFSSSSEIDVTGEKIIYLDEDNIYQNTLDNIKSDDYGISFEKSKLSIDELKEQINNDEIDSALIIKKGETDNSISYTYLIKNSFFSDGVPDYLATVLQSAYQELIYQNLELNEDTIIKLHPTYNYFLEQTEETKGNTLAMMILSILLFYAIYFCAFQVSSSITTEKTSKIIETLVTSTPPRSIVLGKTLGIGLVGLCQLLLYLIVAVICAKLFIEKEVLESIIGASSLTLSLGLITLLYFILGYFTFAFLYALSGSMVSKPEDIQSANSPIAFISLIGFYLAYFSMTSPTSKINFIASLVPISSPFCMPMRIMMGIATPMEVLISIIILIITILIIAYVTIKVYTNAIINYGTKFSFKNIIKLYKQK